MSLLHLLLWPTLCANVVFIYICLAADFRYTSSAEDLTIASETDCKWFYAELKIGEHLLENKMKQPSAETTLTQLLGSPSLGGSRDAPAWYLTRCRGFISQATVLMWDLREPPFCPCSLCPSLLLFVCVRTWMLIFLCSFRIALVLSTKATHISFHILCSALKVSSCCFSEMLDPRSWEGHFRGR